MPELMRAQAVFAHKDGLPRDNVSMNLWFWAPDAQDPLRALAVATRVRDFFREPVAPRNGGLANNFATSIANGGHVVKVYDYDEATGERLSFAEAPPVASLPFDIAGVRDNSVPLPSEVSLCLSFRNNNGATPGGGNFQTPPAQRRGRIYLGPIGQARNVAGPFAEGRPDAAVGDYARAAAAVLITPAGPLPPERWVIYSRPFAGRPLTERPNRPPLRAIPARPGTAYLVQETWTDNAWDTQRRRGERPTARVYG